MSKALLYAAAYLIPQAMPYSAWGAMPVGTNRVIPEPLGTVTLVQKTRDNDEGWAESYEMTLIFEVVTPEGKTAYFKKCGFEDSYGTERWDGVLIPVKQTTKTVTAYTEV